MWVSIIYNILFAPLLFCSLQLSVETFLILFVVDLRDACHEFAILVIMLLRPTISWTQNSKTNCHFINEQKTITATLLCETHTIQCILLVGFPKNIFHLTAIESREGAIFFVSHVLLPVVHKYIQPKDIVCVFVLRNCIFFILPICWYLLPTLTAEANL